MENCHQEFTGPKNLRLRELLREERRHALCPPGQADPGGQARRVFFAAVALDQGHIHGQCNGLIEAGADLKWVYDPDFAKAAELCLKTQALADATKR